MPLVNPINPLAAHIGNGVVQIYVENSQDYEIECSMAQDSGYQKFSNRFFSGKDGYIYGFPVGKTIFIRVRAVSDDGSYTDWVQAKAAEPSLPQTLLRLTAHAGSVIPAGTLFTAKKKTERIYGFRAIGQVDFPVEN